MMLNRRSIISALAAFPFGCHDAFAKSSEDPAKLVWGLGSIQWQRTEHGGARYAVIDGDRDKPGEPFSYAFWMPPGVWVPPHSHTQQAHVSVLKGKLLLGFGGKLDKRATHAIPHGEFFVVRAGVAHYEDCEEERLIIGSALGGWQTRMLD